MRRIALRTALLTAALGLVGPGTARAQGSVTVRIREFGGRVSPVQLTGPTGQAISGAECTANVSIPFELTNLPFAPGTTQVLSVWRAAASGMCQNSMQRRPSAMGAPPCVEVHNQPATGMIMTLSIPVQTLFGTAACAGGTNTEQTFWFMVVSTAGDNTTEVAASHYGTVAITVDPVAPAAPMLDGDAAGDATITVTWTNPAGTEPLFGANIYVDSAGCDASGRPISTTLRGGEPRPSGTAPRVVAEGQTVSSATLSTSGLGLDYGQYAAVAVTLVDRARNESVLSNVICVQRVRVQGFWDAYCAERGLSPSECRDRYDGCAIGFREPARRAVLGWALLALALLAIRRARSAR
jgi:hypothetical protein